MSITPKLEPRSEVYSATHYQRVVTRFENCVKFVSIHHHLIQLIVSSTVFLCKARLTGIFKIVII